MEKKLGTVPKDGVYCAEFLGWVLYERPAADHQEWRSFKLVANGSFEAVKANYWLGWNGERLARNHDTERLARNTDLHAEVLGWLQSHGS